MQGVREYVFSLMVLSFSIGVLELLSPDNKKLSRYVQLTASLIVCAVILSPLQSVMDALPDIFDVEYDMPVFAEEETNATCADIVIEETIVGIREELAGALKDKFGCQVEEIEIICDTSDTENITITKVVVGYAEENRYLFSDTINYIRELMKCECEVYCTGE